MSAFDLLGLTADADERAVKRAYAQRLRVTRPEDDPQGFQQLHAAYQAALEHCRERTFQAPATVPDTPVRVLDEAFARPTVPLATPSPAAPISAPPAPPRFDPEAFCRAAFERAATGEAPALQQWLAGLPELWSLQLKSQTGAYLLQQLYQHAPPMSEECLETLLHFFDLDHALAGNDPLALLRLGRRTRLAWQLQDTSKDVLTTRLAIRTSSQRWRVHWIVRQLKRPFTWRRVLFVGLNSANAGLIAEFVESTSEQHPEDLPATIDRTQLAFWLAAADRSRITRPRLILGGARSAVMLLLGLVLAPLLSLFSSGSLSAPPMLITLGVLMVPSALWALWMAWSLLFSWYLQPESSLAQRPVRRYLVPALCAIGIVLDVFGQDDFGLLLIAPAAWIAVRRYWRYHASRYGLFRSGYVRIMLLLSIPVLHAVLNAELGSNQVSFDAVVAAVAMLAWAADLRKPPLPETGAA